MRRAGRQARAGRCLHRTARPAGRRQDHLRAPPAACAGSGRAHQEPHLRGAGALRSCRAWRSRTLTSIASTTRASGDAGFREIFAAPGLKLAEWPEKAGDLLPLADLRLHIEPEPGENGDRARCWPKPARPAAWSCWLDARCHRLTPGTPPGLATMGRLVLLLAAPAGALGANGAAIPTIVAVRVWPARDYTRVTIESDQPLAASHLLDQAPHRLVVDLNGLELNAALRELVGKVRPDDPYIAGVRVGQYLPRVVRLVVDLKQPVRPEQFTLAPVGPTSTAWCLTFFRHAGSRPAAGADPRQGSRRAARRHRGAGRAGRADRAHRESGAFAHAGPAQHHARRRPARRRSGRRMRPAQRPRRPQHQRHRSSPPRAPAQPPAPPTAAERQRVWTA
jgi:hypothetical protein